MKGLKPKKIPETATPLGVPVHREAVATLAERMGRGCLRCGNCGKEEQLSLEMVEKCLLEGWPKCCKGTLEGGTMGFFSAKDKSHAV